MPLNRPVLHVDLQAVQNNFRTVQILCGPSVSVSAVVKSDAYGLGLDRLAGPLHEAGCTSYFVANLQEALRLRRTLPFVDVLVLSGVRPSEVGAFRSSALIAVCNTPAEVATAVSAGIAHALNFETGFCRLGLRLDEVRSLAHSKPAMPVLIMSHLACADDLVSQQNNIQRDRFIGMSEILGLNVPRSLAASSGIALGQQYLFDRVRVGSALYGLNAAVPSSVTFETVIRLSARLIDLRPIPRGEAVGYMATFRTQRRTLLGIVGIGYKHGLAWLAANRFSAELGGYLAPLVGRISMEYCAIDLTDVPTSLAHCGARVDFISRTNPPESFARCANTVPQELLVRAGASCKRRYGHSSYGFKG